MKNFLFAAAVLLTCAGAPAAVFADGPVLSGTTDIRTEATSAAGATVSFSVTATDASSTPLSVACDPSSGSMFTLGTTTVSCSASDSAFATSTASFSVTVVDTTPPSLIPPPDQSFATSTFPAPLTLVNATATDTVDPTPVISYTPLTFSSGTTTLVWTATDASGNTATSTSLVTVSDSTSATTSNAYIAVRDGATLIGPIAVTLSGSSTVQLSPTGATTTYAVPANSVLALLASLDAATSTFDITDLQYFSSFSSFLVNCISVPASSAAPDCYSWTYAVNGSFPASGMDTNVLQNGDTAYVFFGSGWQVSADKTAAETGETVTVTAETYDAATDTYIPASGVVVGAVQFDSNFNATEFATSTTDSNGHASLSVATAGTYSLGVQSTGYYPSVSLAVTNPAPVSSGGGGTSPVVFNSTSALAYLVSKQNTDGSFSAPLYTDWAAIAFGTAPSNAGSGKLSAYMRTSSPTMSSVSDYERHAIALEALGIDPYSGTPVNYIAPIISAFDGTQIGTSDFRDDIFGLLALMHAGYGASDAIIQKAAAYVISKQSANGAWGDPDTTGAAIQALGPLYAISGVNAALGKGAGYLASTQHSDGGWGSIDSTSWIQTAINGIIEAHTPGFETENSWKSSGGKLPTDALATAQQSDGAVRPASDSAENRVWSTSYAVVAASGKSWVSILSSFPRPASSGGGGSTDTGTTTPLAIATSTTATSTTATSSVATSTSATATSTTSIATSTPSIARMALTSTTQPTHLTTTNQKSPVKKTAPAITRENNPPTSTTSNAIRPDSQVAASASSDGVLHTVWNALVSFFRRLF
ncbi:hypothetical protein K8R03_03775 [Candidatus Kaiserbacteria bacterium]|nr:hypothetical protein [Candidatus Kaiserbacteria bacterium]